MYQSNKRRTGANFLNEREPVVIVGGFMTAPSDYISWQRMLAKPAYKRGSVVANIDRRMWGENAGDLSQHIVALEKAVKRARQVTNAKKVWLVCHSAGGTVARLWMGHQGYNGLECGGHELVRGAIFLGTPHHGHEQHARASTEFANSYYPGAFYEDIRYISAVGKSVFAKKFGTVAERLAYKSYQMLHPRQPEQWGDGVVTLAAAHLQGAENFILNGVHHLGFLRQPGYFSPQALQAWSGVLAQDEAAALRTA